MSIRILENVCAELKDCNAITSNREFCVSWLAKDASYLRVLRHHKSEPSADALANCASKLGYYAYHFGKSEKPEHQEWVKRFKELRDQCLNAMDQQARIKWMTPQRMSL
jgi:hypothetical protein